MGVKKRIQRGYVSRAVLLTEAFEKFYIAKDAKNLSEETLRCCKQSFERFMTFHGFTEETTVAEISITHIYEWIADMKSRGVKPVSINHYLRNISDIHATTPILTMNLSTSI